MWPFKKKSERSVIPYSTDLKVIINQKQIRDEQEKQKKKKERLQEVRKIIGDYFYKGDHPFKTGYPGEYHNKITNEEVDSIKDELEKLGYKIETETNECYRYWAGGLYEFQTTEELVIFHEQYNHNAFANEDAKKEFIKRLSKSKLEQRIISIKE